MDNERTEKTQRKEKEVEWGRRRKGRR